MKYSIQDIMEQEGLQEHVFKTSMTRESTKFKYIRVKVQMFKTTFKLIQIIDMSERVQNE